VSVENGRATLALFLVGADHLGLGQHVAYHRRFHFEPEADIFCGVPIMCYIRTGRVVGRWLWQGSRIELFEGSMS
jgi:hypothetical protein